jgi:hypothetical protein
MNNNLLQKSINTVSSVQEAPFDGSTYSRRDGTWVSSSTIGNGGTETKIYGTVTPPFENIFSWDVDEETEPTSIYVDLLAYDPNSKNNAGRFILEGSFWKGSSNVRASSVRRRMENIPSSQNLILITSGANTVNLQFRTNVVTLNYRAVITFNPWEAFE